jgi:hypothetical protein
MNDFSGAQRGSRTLDLRITSALLYRLSYLGEPGSDASGHPGRAPTWFFADLERDGSNLTFLATFVPPAASPGGSPTSTEALARQLTGFPASGRLLRLQPPAAFAHTRVGCPAC